MTCSISAYGESAPPLIEMEHRAGSRKPKKNLVHRYLAYEKDEHGKVEPWSRPLLRVQQRCQHTIRTMKALPLDPNKPDDVDTKAEDHAYDETSFALSSRPPLPDKRRSKFDQDNQHPGFDYDKRATRSEMEWGEDPSTPIVRNPVSYKVSR